MILDYLIPLLFLCIPVMALLVLVDRLRRRISNTRYGAVERSAQPVMFWISLVPLAALIFPFVGLAGWTAYIIIAK